MPRLWQGSRPQHGARLRELGFDTVVLCAEEYQSPRELDGVHVLRVPLCDDGTPPTKEHLRSAEAMAADVAKRWANGERVLVTCWMGINRSGLVTALTLHRALGLSGRDATTLVRAARKGALSNHWFRNHLAGFRQGKPQVQWDAEAREYVLENAAATAEDGLVTHMVYRPSQ